MKEFESLKIPFFRKDQIPLAFLNKEFPARGVVLAADIGGNATIISPGTGLGEAGLYWDGKKHHPFVTEGGHCYFSRILH